jgi:hypothetical protein
MIILRTLLEYGCLYYKMTVFVILSIPVPIEGFEPSNFGLQVDWSTTVLPRHNKMQKNLTIEGLRLHLIQNMIVRLSREY